MSGDGINLVAMMVVRNEMGRYLKESIPALEGFCDLIVVLDDGSTDGTFEWLTARDSVVCGRIEDQSDRTTETFVHEARVRQELLDGVAGIILRSGKVQERPTFLLAIDADEFVTAPDVLRETLARGVRIGHPYGAYNLCMKEVWHPDEDGLWIRQDGGWVEHDITIVFRCPTETQSPGWRFPNVALACGRTPPIIGRMETTHSCSSILHFGWAKRSERQARYDRYAVADGGAFHASSHLDSIMWPEDRIQLGRLDWPTALEERRAGILRLAECSP